MKKQYLIWGAIIITVIIIAVIIWKKMGGTKIGQPGFGRPATPEEIDKVPHWGSKAKKALAAGYYVPRQADTYGESSLEQILGWMWEISTPGNWGEQYKSDMVALAEHASWQRKLQREHTA
jgi:hypothetical protein